MAELGGAMRQELRRSRLPLRIALAVVGLVLVIGAVFVWRWLPNRALPYSLEVAAPDAQAVVFTLVRDGSVVERVESRPGGATTVDLAPGTYEVFVNDRYTGRVIRVPEDPRAVTAIPVPLPPATGAEP
jgi:hypothetical protein